MNAVLKNIRISPKKLNLVCGMVRGKSVDEALRLLQFLPKKAAPLIYKAMHSAASNAEHNFNQERSNLVVKEIIVNTGPTLKRMNPVSRGRARRILKRTAHLRISLGVK